MGSWRTIRLSLFIAAAAVLLTWCGFETARRHLQGQTPEQERLSCVRLDWEVHYGVPPSMGSYTCYSEGNNPFEVLRRQMGPQPDFDTLIDLITSTIAPTTWDSVGGLEPNQELSGNLQLGPGQRLVERESEPAAIPSP